MKRIFRYLRGTSDVGLIYGGDTQCLVTGYSDSDYAGDVDTRRSMTGYVFTLGGLEDLSSVGRQLCNLQ